MINFTTDKSNFGLVKHVFPFSHGRIEAKQVYFNVECPGIPNLAAGHVDAFQHKPSRLVAVVCYCFCQSVGRLLLVYRVLML